MAAGKPCPAPSAPWQSPSELRQRSRNLAQFKSCHLFRLHVFSRKHENLGPDHDRRRFDSSMNLSLPVKTRTAGKVACRDRDDRECPQAFGTRASEAHGGAAPPSRGPDRCRQGGGAFAVLLVVDHHGELSAGVLPAGPRGKAFQAIGLHQVHQHVLRGTPVDHGDAVSDDAPDPRKDFSGGEESDQSVPDPYLRTRLGVNETCCPSMSLCLASFRRPSPWI
jgi:hypothetical protein